MDDMKKHLRIVIRDAICKPAIISGVLIMGISALLGCAKMVGLNSKSANAAALSTFAGRNLACILGCLFC